MGAGKGDYGGVGLENQRSWTDGGFYIKDISTCYLA